MIDCESGPRCLLNYPQPSMRASSPVSAEDEDDDYDKSYIAHIVLSVFACLCCIVCGFVALAFAGKSLKLLLLLVKH